MSGLGTWFVMCPASRAIPMSDLAARLHIPSAYSAEMVRDKLVVSVPDEKGGEPASVTIGRSLADHVASEAHEFALRHADERRDRDTIASYDARYELVWELENSEALFDPVFWIASEISDLTGGVTYNVTNDMYVSKPR